MTFIFTENHKTKIVHIHFHQEQFIFTKSNLKQTEETCIGLCSDSKEIGLITENVDAMEKCFGN